MLRSTFAVGLFLLAPPALAAAPCDGAKGVRHDNSGAKVSKAQRVGGFVAETAFVERGAFIGSAAQVCGSATIGPGVRVYGHAVVGGEAILGDQAKVFGRARVEGNAVVRGRAMVSGDARVFGTAVVSGRAIVRGYARLGDGTYEKGVVAPPPSAEVKAELAAARARRTEKIDAKQRRRRIDETIAALKKLRVDFTRSHANSTDSFERHKGFATRWSRPDSSKRPCAVKAWYRRYLEDKKRGRSMDRGEDFVEGTIDFLDPGLRIEGKGRNDVVFWNSKNRRAAYQLVVHAPRPVFTKSRRYREGRGAWQSRSAGPPTASLWVRVPSQHTHDQLVSLLQQLHELCTNANEQ